MGLKKYKEKRNFKITGEPSGVIKKKEGKKVFVIQKHNASHLHYDFRLELNGVLKSWAVPKGPTLDPKIKRLAIEVEDHPIDYASFEGIIPEKQYGAGIVMIWDKGEWICEGNPIEAFKKGHLKFTLKGDKLKGQWHLIKVKSQPYSAKQNAWLLIKIKDEFADSSIDVLKKYPKSVVSNRTTEEIGQAKNKDNINKKSLKSKVSKRPKNILSNNKMMDSNKTINEDLHLLLEKLPLAKKKSMPNHIFPELAFLVDKTPDTDEWIHEIKYDGYRIICFIKNKKIKLITRNGNDWTSDFSSLLPEIEALNLNNVIFDGEMVAIDKKGKLSFQFLQDSIKKNIETPYIYFIFDILYCNGYDLTQIPLIDRKALLQTILENYSHQNDVIYSKHIIGHGSLVFQEACAQEMEGIISKKIDSPYEFHRSHAWVKSKCTLGQEFIIIGFTKPKRSRQYLGALLLGFYNEKHELIYCGKVGTGFNHKTLADLYQQFSKIIQKKPPLNNIDLIKNRKDIIWIKPQLIAEIHFTEFTRDGILRHPSFISLRSDKKPKQIHREKAIYLHPSRLKKRAHSMHSMENLIHSDIDNKPYKPDNIGARKTNLSNDKKNDKKAIFKYNKNQNEIIIDDVKITHPNKILYPDSNISKIDIISYYESVIDLLLPHWVNRPLSVLRCPEGFKQQCFFQKHFQKKVFSKHLFPIKIKSEKEDYFYIKNKQGLLTLIQMNVLEFHPWGSKVDNIEKPDRITFDLDPGPDISWEALIEATLFIREQLKIIGLESYLKTTGGKGFHIVIPIMRTLPWEDMYSFTKDFAFKMTEVKPEIFVATMAKSKREGKIFLDYLRNSKEATAVGVYSTRARNKASISTPLFWEEIHQINSADEFNIMNISIRLKNINQNPWEGFFEIKQSINQKVLKNLKKLS